MKHLLLFLLVTTSLLLPLSAFALEVSEGAITTQVVERAPVDAISSIPATTGKLYCFTRITGGSNDKVVHVWRYEGTEMARVELSVRSANWRTWSSKTILPEWKGAWSVDVLDTSGAKLTTIPFTLL